MFAYIWPIALVVLSNVVYQICTKSVPEEMNPMASLTVTYLVGAVASGALYFLLGGRDLFGEYSKMNWSPFLLGVVIVGLEAGYIFAYKAGWKVSTLATVSNAALAVILIFVGLIGYHEAISWSKVLGAAICLAGLYFINKK